MGGLRRHMPITAATFLVAALANAGVFPLAGFWSKDEILHAAVAQRQFGLFAIGVLGAFLTGLYMLRAYYLAFAGEPRGDARAHESPAVMTWPLVILALFAAGVGFIGVPPEHGLYHALVAPVLTAGAAGEHAVGGSLAVAGISLAAAVAGLGLATWLYWLRPGTPARLAARYSWVYRVLWNRYYVDEAYDRALVQPIRRTAVWLWRGVDEPVIDGSVNGLGAVVQAGSVLLRRLQTGHVMSYVLGFLAGAVVVVGYLTVAG
jgi:NADH-quinone oxidoreductase subunit L